MSEELESLKQCEADHLQVITELKSTVKDLKEQCKAYKNALTKYVEPAIATNLLKRLSSVPSSTTTIVNEDITDKEIITAGTRIVSPVLQDLMIKKEVEKDV